MSVAYKRGSTTYPDDLNITVRDCSGNLIDPYRLQYAVFDKTTGIEVLQGSPVCTPVKIATGKYFAQVVFPADCNIGDWVIRWTIQDTSVDPIYQSVQDFNVVGDSTIVSFTGNCDMDKLIYSLRIMLRDQNPDRNYRTRSPESERFIQGMTQVFGFIWEDEEMNEYLYMACDAFNAVPPVTGIEPNDLWGKMRRWRTAILYNASAIACRALSTNWIADEFSLSQEELLKIKIGKQGQDIYISIGLLFLFLYSDSIKEGKKLAIEGIRVTGLECNLEDVQIISEKYSIEDLKYAYKSENLFIQSMDKDGLIDWKPISKVMRHNCPKKKLLKVTTELGEVIVTEDHSLFSWSLKSAVPAKTLLKHDLLIGCDEKGICPVWITDIEPAENRQYMFDLAIPGNENFFLANGLLAHNSYSISGVSLDIEKASKYQTMADVFTQEYDKLAEAAKRSIIIFKGLKQSKYGVGIQSALGPLSRPGIQSRRNFCQGGGGGWS